MLWMACSLKRSKIVSSSSSTRSATWSIEREVVVDDGVEERVDKRTHGVAERAIGRFPARERALNVVRRTLVDGHEVVRADEHVDRFGLDVVTRGIELGLIEDDEIVGLAAGLVAVGGIWSGSSSGPSGCCRIACS